MFPARLAIGFIGLGLSYPAKKFLTQQTNLFDDSTLNFVQRAATGNHLVTQVRNPVHPLSHDRIIGKSFIQRLFTNRRVFISHGHLIIHPPQKYKLKLTLTFCRTLSAFEA